jgi:hypothetical protein
MKLSALPQQSSTSTSGSQNNNSRVDHLFVNSLPKRLEEQRHLVKTIKSIYQWNLTRDGKIASIWSKKMFHLIFERIILKVLDKLFLFKNKLYIRPDQNI